MCVFAPRSGGAKVVKTGALCRPSWMLNFAFGRNENKFDNDTAQVAFQVGAGESRSATCSPRRMVTVRLSTPTPSSHRVKRERTVTGRSQWSRFRTVRTRSCCRHVLLLAMTWQVWCCTRVHTVSHALALNAMLLTAPRWQRGLLADAGGLDGNVHGARHQKEMVLAGIQELCDGILCERVEDDSVRGRTHPNDAVGS